MMFHSRCFGGFAVARSYRPLQPRPRPQQPSDVRPGQENTRQNGVSGGSKPPFRTLWLPLLAVCLVLPVTAVGQIPKAPIERVDEERSVEKQWDAARAARNRVRQGSDPIDEVIVLLGDSSGTVRDEVFEEIVNKWSAEQRRLLRSGFSSRNNQRSGFVDEILAEIFLRCPDSQLLPDLLAVAVNSDVAEAREMALGAIGELPSTTVDVKSLKVIEKLAKRERNWWIRGEALRCLARHDGDRAEPLIQSALKEKKLPALRIAALQGLALFEPQRACEEARKAITEPWKDRQGIWGDRIIRAALQVLSVHLVSFPRDQRALFITDLLAASETLQGATRERMWLTLAAISGETAIADNFDAWNSWWLSRQQQWIETGEPGGSDAAKEPAGAVEEKSSDQIGKTRVVQYHGVPLDSKRLVFLADVSGGMSRTVDGQFDGEGPRRIDVSRNELLRVLAELPADALVQVVHFASRSDAALPRVQPLARSIRMLNDKIKKQQVPSGRGAARGNLYGPLRRAVLEAGTDTVMLLTEGAPTEGKVQNGDRLRWHIRRWNRWGQARIHVLSVGRIRGENRAFLEGLAADGAGAFYDVDGNFGKVKSGS